MQEDYQNQIIQELINHELSLNKLYGVYAEKFPEYKDFWEKIAQEETQHAAWIKGLDSKIQENTVLIDKDRFNTQMIQTSTVYVHSQIASALQHNLKLINALSIAVDIEQTMLENKFFQVFEKATQEHLKKVKDFWEEERTKENLA